MCCSQFELSCSYCRHIYVNMFHSHLITNLTSLARMHLNNCLIWITTTTTFETIDTNESWSIAILLRIYLQLSTSPSPFIHLLSSSDNIFHAILLQQYSWIGKSNLKQKKILLLVTCVLINITYLDDATLIQIWFGLCWTKQIDVFFIIIL